MKTYKVAYICTPVDFGGAEKVSIHFLENINREKFNVCPMLLVRPWEQDNFFLSKLGELGYSFSVIPVAKQKLSDGRDYFRLIRCFRLILSLLKKGNFDLVHTHGYFADILGGIAGKKLGIPVISTCHGFIMNNWKYRLYNGIDVFVLKYFSRIISVSEQIKDVLIGKGVDESKIVVIQNVVSLPTDNSPVAGRLQAKKDFLKIKQNDLVIGYVGRLSKEKGLLVLMEAFLLLEKKHPDLKLMIIGSGPLRLSLESFAKDNQFFDKIIFTGFQKNIEDWLPLLDVFVLPSFSEGTPMALLEAMSYGISVVATSVGGIPKVINSGENGILIKPGSTSELANAIAQLIEDSNLRSLISVEGTRTIGSDYSMEAWMNTMERIYIDTINDVPSL